MDVGIWIVVGIVTGFIGERLVNRSQGLLINLIVGLVGAVLGGIVARTIDVGLDDRIAALVFSALGAVILLLVLRLMKTARR